MRYSITVGTGSLQIGSMIAVVMSYLDYHSVWWALIDGLLGWFYIMYRVL